MAGKSTSMKTTLKITSFILRLLLNITFYVLVIVMVISVSRKVYNFAYQVYGPVTVDEAPGREKPIQIQQGEGTMDIASKLELNRLIVNKYSFYAKVQFQKAVIMPGTYMLNTSMTYDEIIEIITDYSQSIIQEVEEVDDLTEE